VDAAGETASMDEAGGSVTESEAEVEDEDSVEEVEEVVKGSVEVLEASALVVMTLGGPTAAMISPTTGTAGQSMH
jgi:hypothetical protein